MPVLETTALLYLICITITDTLRGEIHSWMTGIAILIISSQLILDPIAFSLHIINGAAFYAAGLFMAKKGIWASGDADVMLVIAYAFPYNQLMFVLSMLSIFAIHSMSYMAAYSMLQPTKFRNTKKGMSFVKSFEKAFFVHRIPIEELKEGDIIAGETKGLHPLIAKGMRISRNTKTIRIQDGMRCGIVFLLATIITYFL